MGDAVMERVARVPTLPEVETGASGRSGPGNAWRAAQAAGGPSSTTDGVMDRAHKGWLSSLLGFTEPSDGITADLDEANQRVWLTRTVGKNFGTASPPDSEEATDALEPLWGGAANKADDGPVSGSLDQRSVRQTCVRVGVPWSRAHLSAGASNLPLRAAWVAELAGIDDRAWSAAARLLAGDPSAASELPAGVIVRSGEEDLRGVSVEADLASVGLSVDGDVSATQDVELRRVGGGDEAQWVLTIRTEQATASTLGASLGLDFLKIGAAHSSGSTQGETRTLVAPVQDAAAVAALFDVVAAAHRGDPSPVDAVPEAYTLERRRAHTSSTSENDQFSGLSELLQFNEGGTQSVTEVEEDGVRSAYGEAHSNYDIRVGKDLELFDTTTTLASIGGDATWAAEGDRLSMTIGGGSMSKGFGEGRDPTSVRLDTRDVDALVQYAGSSSLWTRSCNDPLVTEAWNALREALVHTESLLRAEHVEIEDASVLPQAVLHEARAIAISNFVSLRAGTVDVLRTALGRDEAVVTPNVLGVLESWPAGTEPLHARYDALGKRLEALERGAWGPDKPDETLLRLEAEANAVKAGVSALSQIPARARLEMLGQVFAWQDALDVAWGRLGEPVGARVDSGHHRPDSVERLDLLARRCRSEAAPHLQRLLGMVARDADPDAADMASVSELAGIMSTWKWAAADLARASRAAGLSPMAWLVGSVGQPRSELDPDLPAWDRIVRHMIEHDARIPESWVNLR
jgi:hypothetical protein